MKNMKKKKKTNNRKIAKRKIESRAYFEFNLPKMEYLAQFLDSQINAKNMRENKNKNNGLNIFQSERLQNKLYN